MERAFLEFFMEVKRERRVQENHNGVGEKRGCGITTRGIQERRLLKANILSRGRICSQAVID